MRVFLGKPTKQIITFIQQQHRKNNKYSADEIAQIIDAKFMTLPVETQQAIQNKVNEAQAKNPSLQDGCEELQSIKLVEIAKAYGIDIEEVIGKTEPRTEDDDAKIAKKLKKI